MAQVLAPPLSAPIPYPIPHTSDTALEAAPGESPRSASPLPIGVPRHAPPSGGARTGSTFTWPVVALLAWLLGAVVVLAFFAAGRITLARASAGARRIDDASWLLAAREIAERLGVRQPLRGIVGRLDGTDRDRREPRLVEHSPRTGAGGSARGRARHFAFTPRLAAHEKILGASHTSEVRVQAAEGLGRHPGARALETLVKLARKDRSQDVRREAAETIGDLDYAPATNALIALCRELEDDLVRAEAVETLGEREPERVVPVLVEISAQDPSEMVRREAVETLGDLPGNAGLEPLRRMAMHSEDPAVRSEAMETLNDLGQRAKGEARRLD